MFIRSLSLRMSLLISARDVTSVISAVPFKIVLQKGLIVDFEKPRSRACL